MKHALVLVAATTLLLAGCGGGAAAPESAAPAAPEERTLTVFAASSLTDVFAELETQFEAANPGVDVVVNPGASSDLAQQIANGGPADVFASASDATMKTVTDAGLLDGEPAIFAKNQLQIVTAPGNPEGITGFADLADPDLQVVVCAPQVPCGAAAEKIETATGTALTPVSEEENVRAVLDRVTTGNADAGLVYVTDVNSAGDTVTGVDFPESAEAVTNYPIGVLSDAPQPELARAWQDLVTGPDGQAVLAETGFIGAS